MNFNPLLPPKPHYYKEWYEARRLRTIEVCENQDTIDGHQIHNEMLSLKIIKQYGFVHNKRFDRMEKDGR